MHKSFTTILALTASLANADLTSAIDNIFNIGLANA